MKKSFILLAIVTILSSCEMPSPESVETKIKNRQELSTADKKAVFEYLDEMMDDVKTDALGYEAAKRLKEQYPYHRTFLNYLNKSEDNEIRKMTTNFIKEAKNNGKDKVYTYNPMYHLIIWRSESIPVTDLECELISDFICAALTSGYKAEELKDRFNDFEAVMVNWSHSSDPMRNKAIDDGIDKTIKSQY